MVFFREWDETEKSYKINRDRTGPPPAPETGKTVTTDGTVVGDSSGVSIPPPTPIKVNLPGPNEPVIDARGMLTPRWRRFIEELYRRTGAYEDNINSVDRDVGSTSTTGSLAITGYAPLAKEDHYISPSTASVAISSSAITAVVSNSPAAASLSISSEAPIPS